MKSQFKKSLHLVALGITLSLAANTSRAESLADALVSAYNHSGLLEQNRALLRAADEDVAAAGAALILLVLAFGLFWIMDYWGRRNVIAE